MHVTAYIISVVLKSDILPSAVKCSSPQLFEACEATILRNDREDITFNENNRHPKSKRLHILPIFRPTARKRQDTSANFHFHRPQHKN